MPSAGNLQSARSAEVAMPADPPEDHLDEHALVNLNEQFFNNPAACVSIEKRQRRAAVQPRMRVSQPSQSPLTASVNGFRQRKYADHAQYTVRLLDGQPLTPGAA